jgi:hypothetical protein
MAIPRELAFSFWVSVIDSYLNLWLVLLFWILLSPQKREFPSVMVLLLLLGVYRWTHARPMIFSGTGNLD